jgi:hypothetical protein
MRFLLVTIVLAGLSCSLAVAGPIDFARDVRPILEKHCFDCHSSDYAESDLRLDMATTILDGGNSGPAVVPGKSDKSLLILRATAADGHDPMPPEGEGEPLNEQQIAILREWINQGAKVPSGEQPVAAERKTSDHWSFQPIVRPALPDVQDHTWVQTPIDSFVLARLESQGIVPSPETDRTTLIRRLSLDLRGLPPSPEEVDEFLRDQSPDEYAALVDRFLASPQYGERWARHWLDQARYADSDGYTNDVPRSIWKYRDWVIDALNADVPFDEFTIDQIAGDLRPEATDAQIIATGFHRNTQHNREGGSDPEQYRVERVVDRLNTTGEVFLGLTIGCARCHDHKYDPVSQREFYQLYAFFDSCDEPTYPVWTPEKREQQAGLKKQVAAAEQELKQYDNSQTPRQAEWERQLARTSAVQWTVLDPDQYESTDGATITKLDDRSLLVGGKIPGGDTYLVSAIAPIANVTGVRLEALTHDSLPSRGPGLTSHGNFVLYEFRVTARPDGQQDETPLSIVAAAADHSQQGFPIADAIDDDLETGWAINVAKGEGSLNVDRTALFVLEDPVVHSSGIRLAFVMEQDHPGPPPYQIGRFRLAVTDAPAATLLQADISPKIQEILALPEQQRTADQKQTLATEFRKNDSKRLKLAAALDKLKAQEKALVDSVPTTLVMRQRTTPRTTYVHLRGDFLSKGRQVYSNVPAVLPPLGCEVDNPSRMDLARWLVRRDNPLTARVIVNRVWQAYFGLGLVETDNDFGTQGSPPTHPELLDWLADEFVTQGWSLKGLHRLIVTSAVYRQSSLARADLVDVDPRNRLLARQSRFRLEAEIIRDSALAAAGLLSDKIGGPSVFPPQPAGVMTLTRNPNRQWSVSQGDDRYRRGLYTYFWRSTPYPFLKAFDAPDSNATCTRRDRSNTPLQALMLLNDEVFYEAAQGLAARLLAKDLTDDSARIRRAFRLCLVREPGTKELQTLLDLLHAERANTATDSRPFKTPALDRAPKDVSATEIIAWTAVTRALLNLDEFITRE